MILKKINAFPWRHTFAILFGDGLFGWARARLGNMDNVKLFRVFGMLA